MMFNRVAKRRDVKVKFVGDEDVIENITVVNNRKNIKKQANIVYDQLKAENISLSQNEDDYQTPSALCPTQNEVNGREMFQFAKEVGKRTPGKKPSQTASESPSASRKSVTKTPKSTPKRNAAVKSSQENGSTPYSLRKRQSCRNAFDEVHCDSDPEGSDFEGSDSDTDDEDEDVTTPSKGTSSQKKNMKTFAEGYFTAQKNSKSATSNRTLSKVTVPKTSVQDLQALLEDTSQFHKREKSRLYKDYKVQFKKWLFQLQEGFNVLLYGVGSKLKLLQKLRSECLSDCLCVEINGFYPSLTIKKVLNTITEDVIGHEGSFANVFEQVEFIKEHFVSVETDFYLLIHNIDGYSLRAVKCQTVLSSLAASPRIHIVASVDHINCSLVWDQIMLSQFQWIWHCATTYEPYVLETSYESSLLREQSSQLLLSSLLHVFLSLTPNNRGVFMILAKYQMNKKDNGGYLGITFHEWYQECREAFLVNSESTMNTQMSEFKNHKLLSSRKSAEGIEYWYIPVDPNTLEQFLERDEIQ